MLALHLASGSQQLAALTLATCVLWLLARAGARGLRTRPSRVGLAFGLAALALLPRLEMLREATASGYVDPDGIGSLLFGDRRGLVGRFGVSHSEIATLYLGAATPALALIGWRRGARDGAPVRLLGWLIAFSLAWATGLIGWLMDPLPLVRTVAGHEPVRGIVLALLCLSLLAAFALPELKRWPGALSVAALGLVVGVLAGGTGGFALSYLIPLAAGLRRARAAPVPARAARAAGRAGRRPGLAGHAPGSAPALADRLAGRSGALRERRLPARAAARRGAVPLRDGSARARARAPAGRAPLGRARALLLDQEGLRLGLEDVSGYNPVHLKSYNRLMLASNGGRDGRPPLRARAALRDAAAALARRALLRLAARAAAAGPAGRLPRPPQRRHARRRGTAVRAHVRPGRAPLAARVVSREPDRIVIAPPAAGRLVVADLAYPGWKVEIDGEGAESLERRRSARRAGAGRGRSA